MNKTWRYFDYDYDNECIIIISDESDDPIGFIASDLKYPINANDTLTVCIVSLF